MTFWVPARRPEPELLDAADVSSSDAEESLADIEWVHRRLGGRALLKRRLLPLLASLPPHRRTLSVLDLGCGSGHVGRDLVSAAEEAGLAIRVLGLDRKVSHARLVPRGDVVAADALRLPFGDASIDVVFSTLFLHHFSPAEVARVFAESRRVAARCVFALDLSRHRLALAAIALIGPLAFRSHLSVQDGKTSVRQAYTSIEIADLAASVLPGARVAPLSRFVWELVWRRP